MHMCVHSVLEFEFNARSRFPYRDTLSPEKKKKEKNPQDTLVRRRSPNLPDFFTLPKTYFYNSVSVSRVLFSVLKISFFCDKK